MARGPNLADQPQGELSLRCCRGLSVVYQYILRLFNLEDEASVPEAVKPIPRCDAYACTV